MFRRCLLSQSSGWRSNPQDNQPSLFSAAMKISTLTSKWVTTTTFTTLFSSMYVIVVISFDVVRFNSWYRVVKLETNRSDVSVEMCKQSPTWNHRAGTCVQGSKPWASPVDCWCGLSPWRHAPNWPLFVELCDCNSSEDTLMVVLTSWSTLQTWRRACELLRWEQQ